MPQKWMITGGAGFIGVNLMRILAASEREGCCFDDMSVGTPADAEAAGFDDIVVGSVLDQDALLAATRDVDVVVHLAAQTGVPSSIEDPRHDLLANVVGTFNVLQAVRENRVGSVIVASSAAPIGSAPPPMHEQTAPRPLSPYGASKLAAEGYVSAFAGSFDVHGVALRFSNVYGPWSYHKGSVVAEYFGQIARREPLTLNGGGEQTRDFVYVDDICHAIVAASTKGSPGAVYQLGTGIETPIIELASRMNTLAGRSPEMCTTAPALTADVARSFADIGLARRELGYVPQTSLEQGLRLTLDWFRSIYDF